MTPWGALGRGDCRVMAFAVFASGMLSWYTWKGSIRVSDMWLPFLMLDVDIAALEQRPLVLGGVEVSPWLVGILLVVGGVWLWKKCSEWKAGGVPGSKTPAVRAG